MVIRTREPLRQIEASTTFMRALFFFAILLPLSLPGQESDNMTLISNLDLSGLPSRFGSEYNDCWGFRHANGTEVAIIGGIEDIFFVDITIPANPVIIYTHEVLNVTNGTVNQSLWRDFKTYGNYAYACADEGSCGLLVFDMSNVPTSITMVYQTNSFWTRSHNIYIDEENGRLYGAGTNTVSNGLVILNLEPDPAAPTLAANVPLNGVGGGYVHDVHVRDNIAYCSHGSLAKLQVYDFTNLPNFTVLGAIENYPEPGYNHSSWLNSAGNMLVMCDETHGSDVKLVDITDLPDISADDFSTFYSELLGSQAPGSSIAHNPFILGDLAFIAYYHDGVQVFDISDPDNITRIAYYDTHPQNTGYSGYDGCWGVYPYFPSGNIIASDQNNGLFVLQITESTLDIEFLSFRASRKTDGILLDWAVLDPSFGNTFEVQRSEDGGITFQAMGKVRLEDQVLQYQFLDTDVSPSTRYVYRIDFLQLDGSRIKSPLRQVRTEAGPISIRAVNPMSGHLVLDVMNPLEQTDLSLYNLEGRLIWSTTVTDMKARMEFPLPDIAAGHYMLTAQWAGGAENLILQKY